MAKVVRVTDTGAAVALAAPDPGLVAVCCAASFDLETLGREIAARFEGIAVIGCTTAGDTTNG